MKKHPSRGWFRSIDLWVMGPARSRCATLLPLGLGCHCPQPGLTLPGHCWLSLPPFLSAWPPPPHKTDSPKNSSPLGMRSTAPGPGLALLPRLPHTALHGHLPFDHPSWRCMCSRRPGRRLQPWALLGTGAPEIQRHPDGCSPAQKSSSAPSMLWDCTCLTVWFFAGQGGTQAPFA